MADSSQDLIKPEKLLATANIKLKENQNFFRKMKSANPNKLDEIVHQLHEEVRTVMPAPGSPLFCVMLTPATRPCIISTGEEASVLIMSFSDNRFVAPVKSDLR